MSKLILFQGDSITDCSRNSDYFFKIGKHCIIGANSVVNYDIPDYCVAVGAPAKVIKRYDRDANVWIKTEGK